MMTLTESIIEKCESPIESKLADRLLRLLRDGVELEPQKRMSVAGKNFRADFFIVCDGRTTIIECDGKDWHDYWEDFERDTLMLNHGAVDDVFRFRGCDIVFDVDSCARFIRWFAPNLFSAAAKPLTLTERILQSKLLTPCPDKPIHRARIPAEEFGREAASIADCQTFKPISATSDGLARMVEFKTPYWDRKYSGPKAWELGDILRLYGPEIVAREGGR